MRVGDGEGEESYLFQESLNDGSGVLDASVQAVGESRHERPNKLFIPFLQRTCEGKRFLWSRLVGCHDDLKQCLGAKERKVEKVGEERG